MKYFGFPDAQECGKCDNCLKKKDTKKVDFSKEIQLLCELICDMPDKIGKNVSIDILRGMKNKNVTNKFL